MSQSPPYRKFTHVSTRRCALAVRPKVGAGSDVFEGLLLMEVLAFFVAGLAVAGWVATLVAVGRDPSIPQQNRPIMVVGLVIVPAFAPGYWLWRWIGSRSQTDSAEATSRD